MLKDLFFYSVDRLLPRPVARIPYELALNAIQTSFWGKVSGVWHRNSYYQGNYIFGISDLDTTLMLKREQLSHLSSIFQKLNELKTIYPFLGEVNLYIEGEVERFVPSLNIYERRRDPVLSSKLPDRPESDLEVDKIVFLLRTLYSDRTKLFRKPWLRQRKWKQHLEVMKIPVPQLVNHEYIIEVLIQLLALGPVDNQKLIFALDVLMSPNFSEEKLFSREPPIWRYIFPHKYIWFDKGEEKLDDQVDERLRKVLLRQIDWEVWGLMSQMPFIDYKHPGFLAHINRLVRVAEMFEDESGVSERIRSLSTYSLNFHKTE